ncbi:Silenced mating-type M-specific polypeptide Mc [Smittium mucronatum]|uniref:Silenced mating-type M-specific polypeptide Mc n=1 Tax=Smittium mucronatum TaxID=133383 RepID=A0A1R0GVP5_9FUNG|nr:Silenced mating-type M-specific polypeptide Mc [Smittium mucronatum]OLY80976.1 Silenced mating-type M-specific polypeptide Mc [Smittium mucronatum]
MNLNNISSSNLNSLSPTQTFASSSDQNQSSFPKNTSNNDVGNEFLSNYSKDTPLIIATETFNSDDLKYILSQTSPSSNSQKSSVMESDHLKKSKLPKNKRTPRPPNAFILYRKDKQEGVIKMNSGVSNKEISCIIGKMWRKESEEVRNEYKERAENEKIKHQKLYPNYKYQPRKSKKVSKADSETKFGYSGTHCLPLQTKIFQQESKFSEYNPFALNNVDQSISSFGGNQLLNIPECMRDGYFSQLNPEIATEIHNNIQFQNNHNPDELKIAIPPQYLHQQFGYQPEEFIQSEMCDSVFFNNQIEHNYLSVDSILEPNIYNTGLISNQLEVDGAPRMPDYSYISSMTPNNEFVNLKSLEQKNCLGISYNDPRNFQNLETRHIPTLSNSHIFVGDKYPPNLDYPEQYFYNMTPTDINWNTNLENLNEVSQHLIFERNQI